MQGICVCYYSQLLAFGQNELWTKKKKLPSLFLKQFVGWYKD